MIYDAHVRDPGKKQKTAEFMPPGLGFCKAKVFRRTGDRSYSVQLMLPVQKQERRGEEDAPYNPMPGVIEIHCRDVDWLWNTQGMGRDWQEDALHLLEKRLGKLGTRSMFLWTGEGVPECVVPPIDYSEGVEVELGPYVPARTAFVQCRLRANLSKLHGVSSPLASGSSLVAEPTVPAGQKRKHPIAPKEDERGVQKHFKS